MSIMALMLLAALQMVPSDLYEAARVDGASHHGADQTFEAAMCAGLAAFRQELNKRGISQHRYTHLPPGIAPQIKRRTVQPAKRTRTAQAEQAAQR